VTVTVPLQPAEAIELAAALQPPAGAGPAETAATRTVQRRVLLHLRDISFETPPGGTYDVYLNLPEGEEPTFHSPYFVGNLAFFGMEPMEHDGRAQPVRAQRSYDITSNVVVLDERGEWPREEARVTFVRTELLPPLEGDETPAAEATPAPEAPPPPVTIGSVSVEIVP
jgi:hypothetical protein